VIDATAYSNRGSAYYAKGHRYLDIYDQAIARVAARVPDRDMPQRLLVARLRAASRLMPSRSRFLDLDTSTNCVPTDPNVELFEKADPFNPRLEIKVHCEQTLVRLCGANRRVPPSSLRQHKTREIAPSGLLRLV
jgi:hypothetical protein